MSRSEELLQDHQTKRGRDFKPTEKKDAPPVEKKVDNDVDIDDEALLRRIQKNNPHIKSLEDLKPPAPAAPTAEELAEQKKQKRKAALQYGLTHEIVNPEDIVSYERDLETKPQDIYFPQYLAEFRENIKGTSEENDYTDEQIREEFDQEFALTATEGSVRWKNGQKKLENFKNSYIEKTYSKVINLDSTFDEHEETISKATKYKGIVEAAFSDLPPTLTFNLKGNEIPFQPTKDTVAKVKELYLNETAFKTFKDVPLTKEDFTKAITQSLATIDLPSLLSEVAETYFHAESKRLGLGRQGIPDRDVTGEGNISNPKPIGGEGTKNADARLNEHKKHS